VIKNNYIKLSMLSVAVFSAQLTAGGAGGFTELQNNSEAFVRATCDGFNGGQNVQNSLQDDLFVACRSMVQSTNELNGATGQVFSRQLGADDLGGGYQNVVSEETFAPLTIASEASINQYSSIASHISKIRKGSFSVASFSSPYGKSFDLADAKSGQLRGGAAGDGGLLSSSRFGFFVNTIGGFGETDRTEKENASDFSSIGVIAGIDYRLLDNLIVGIAGGYSHLDLDFDRNIDVGGGGVEADNYNISAYSTFYVEDFYIDGIFTYGWSDYEIERGIRIKSNNPTVPVINRTAFASPEGEQFYGSLGSGYNFHTGSLTYGPYVRLTYLNATIDGYSESGARGLDLRVAEQEVDSLESVVGAQISYAFSQSFGIIVPHFRIEWHHEFFDSVREFSISYVNDPRNNTLTLESERLDGDFFNIGVGVSADFQGGIQAFLDYETVLELKNVESHIFTAGLRVEF